MIMIQILSLVLWLAIIPSCCGLGITKFMKIQEGKWSMVIITGHLFMIALFQLIYLPFILWHNNFTHLVYAFIVVIGIFAVLLMLYGSSQLKKKPSSCKIFLKTPIYCKAFWLVVFSMIGFQLYMSVAYQFTDGDDAYYVANSVVTEASDLMFRIIPETGQLTDLEIRRAPSSFTIFIAFLGRVCNIHTTIISHMILPFMLIPLMYLIYMQIGRILLKENKNYLPLFMMMINLFYIYGNHSIYTNATFALTRTWQGKAVLANIMIPATFLGLLYIFNHRPKKGNILFLTMVILGGLSASTMGLLLIPVLLNIGIISYAISNKFWRKEVS